MVERTFAGVSLFVVSGALLGSTWTYAVHGLAFLMACWLLLRSRDWRERTGFYFSSRADVWWLLTGFGIVFALPFLFSSYSELIDVSELKWILVFLGLLMPAGAIIRPAGRTVQIKLAALILILLVLVSTIDGGFQVLTGRNLLREWIGAPVDEFGAGSRRATGFLRNPIPFGHTMGAFFWISAAGTLVAWLTHRRALMTVAAVICFASFASVLFSQTRGAWLAIALVSILSVPILTGRSRKFWLNCLGIAFVVGILGVAFHSETRSRLTSAFDPGLDSNRIRLELWQANYEILKDHPFGIGYNANDQLMEEAFDELGFDKHSWMGHSHNEFVEIAVGSGWLGIGLYLALTFWLIWIAIFELRRVSVEKDPWTAFLLLSSVLIQLFINACALTDQFSTPGRFLLCYAWAIAIVVPVERKCAPLKR